MRRKYFAVLGAAIVLFTAPIAHADECCASGNAAVVYAAPPFVIAIPPIGYVLDPSDARPPIYVVNQGPLYSGPNIVTYPLYVGPLATLAVPTFSEGGYAYADPYPYVRTKWSYGPARWQHRRHRGDWGARYGQFPSVWRSPVYGTSAYPYAAYRYRPAPSARVISIPSTGN